MSKSKEKKYIGKKGIIGYLCASMSNNFAITLMTSYILLFMTDYMGMNAGIVSMLMAVSKLLDGVSDVVAGTIIDRTKSKLGRGRSWMLRMILPMSIVEILMFSMSPDWGDTAIYAYFFVCYTVFNAVLYTLYNIAFSTLPVYITRNSSEQVSLSMANFGGSTVAGTIVSASYLTLIAKFGNDVNGWRTTAIIFCAIFCILTLICVASVRELPKFETEKDKKQENGLKLVIDNVKYLIGNPYFLYQLGIMILYMCTTALFTASLPYYAIYVLKDTTVQGTFSLTAAGIVIGIFFSHLLINKMGMYKSNLVTRIAACIVYLGVIAGALMRNVPVMLIFNLIYCILSGPYLGTINTIVAEISGYSLRKYGVNIEACAFSCGCMGNKVGNALGVALVGWLLNAVHYDGTLAVQGAAAQNMISFIFVISPLIFQILITILLSRLNVQKANKDWDEAHPQEAAELKAKLAALDDQK